MWLQRQFDLVPGYHSFVDLIHSRIDADIHNEESQVSWNQFFEKAIFNPIIG